MALQLGTASLASIASFWNNSVQAAVPKRGRGPARSVILIFNSGAPSHIDLWDPKPDAPDNVRGVFKPISTKVSGIQVSELLPRMAERADKLAIVRSVHHEHSSHNAGMYWSIVGRPYRMDSTLINPSRSDYPSVGTLVGWLAQRDDYAGAVPPYVITPHPHCDSFQYITPGQFGGFLGAKYDPLVVKGDPNSVDFSVPDLRIADGLSPERLGQRSDLLRRLDDHRHAGLNEIAVDYEINRAKALSLVTSADLSSAFDLSKEPDGVRERYGRHTWGQSHLLARRLVEAGVRFVTTVNGPSIVWDTHADNFNTLKNKLVPPMEQAYAALLDDLAERGLLDSTLVVWMGDFGRTPAINGKAGRDHWPQCYSMVLAGGGIRGGQVVGESDNTGGVPRSRPLTPADIHATMFKTLGHDPHVVIYRTADGRPTPLSEGQVIGELL
ncbi:MAG: DUF1501 domain-containing protein [Pirellulales bacterium]